MTPLHIACLHGCNETVRLLLKEAPTLIDIGNKDDYPPIACAGNVDVFNQLLEAGASFNADVEGRDALQLACLKEDLALVKALVDKQVKINTPNELGHSVLTMLKISEDSQAIANFLTSKGAVCLYSDPHIQEDVKYRRVGAMYRWLMAEHDIDSFNAEKMTAIANLKDRNLLRSLNQTELHNSGYRIEEREECILQMLQIVEGHLPLNRKLYDHEITLLMTKGQLSQQTLAIQNMLDISFKDQQTLSSYEMGLLMAYGSEENIQTAITRCLVDINAQDPNGNGFLHLVKLRGLEKLIEWLETKGVKRELLNQSGQRYDEIPLPSPLPLLFLTRVMKWAPTKKEFIPDPSPIYSYRASIDYPYAIPSTSVRIA